MSGTNLSEGTRAIVGTRRIVSSSMAQTTTVMLKIKDVGVGKIFERPMVFYTLAGNARSEQVLRDLLPHAVKKEAGEGAVGFEVFQNKEEITGYFEGHGIAREAGIACFDADLPGNFSYVTRFRGDTFPDWAMGAVFGVRIGAKAAHHNRLQDCAQQVSASFIRHWKYLSPDTEKRKGNGASGETVVTSEPWFPWGSPRKDEAVPRSRDAAIAKRVLEPLNSGPNLSAIVADLECAAELPAGSKISWFRVADAPIECSEEFLGTIAVGALRAFEQVSGYLVAVNEEVRRMLLAGVDLHEHGQLAERYLWPPCKHFSVRRPDLHWDGTGVSASENDEMPGGFAELVHVDQAYGINERRWEECFEWLTEKGTLLFVVSHKWSKCYIPELQWLTGYMRQKGFPVEIVQTDQMTDELVVSDHGVFFRGGKVGTVWRQFPIFETEGKLTEIVEAAHKGLVRLVPEFAHFGNKVWFALFRSHRDFFEKAMRERGEESLFEVLDQILPDSQLVLGEDSFPCEVNGFKFESLKDLIHLQPSVRDELVLKIAGANSLASRSYGVLMGHGLKEDIWKKWIQEQLDRKRPFIIQKRFGTAVETLPVLNTKTGVPEGFRCRLLIRPWVVGERIVSAHTCAVPASTLRVHGRVDMAVVPVVWV